MASSFHRDRCRRRTRVTLLIAATVISSLVMTHGYEAPEALAAAPAPSPSAACIPGYHSAWWSQSPNPQLSAGQSTSVTIQVQNAGCNTWGSNLRMGTWNPIPGQDQNSVLCAGGAPGWSGCNRVVPTSSSYAYGQIASFTFTVRAPATPGFYRLHLRPLIEGVTWMEDQGIYLEVGSYVCTNRSTHDNVARYAASAASVGGVNKIASDIREYDPYYTAFNATGTNATILLVNSNSSQWAQWGWFKGTMTGYVGQRATGLELFLSPSQNYWQFWPAKPVGISTPYNIEYTYPSTFDFRVGSVIYSTKFGSFLPTQYQLFGETHDWVDQMPGGVNQHVTFTNTQYFVGAPRQAYWATAPISTNSPFAASNPSLGRYDIWDTACAN